MVWLSLATPLVLLGALVGAAADRIRRTNQVERHATEVALLECEVALLNDTVLQQLAATKWLLESGRTDDGIALLDVTMTHSARTRDPNAQFEQCPIR